MLQHIKCHLSNAAIRAHFEPSIIHRKPRCKCCMHCALLKTVMQKYIEAWCRWCCCSGVEFGASAHYAMRCARQRRVTKVGITCQRCQERPTPPRTAPVQHTKNVPELYQFIPCRRLTNRTYTNLRTVPAI